MKAPSYVKATGGTATGNRVCTQEKISVRFDSFGLMIGYRLEKLYIIIIAWA